MFVEKEDTATDKRVIVVRDVRRFLRIMGQLQICSMAEAHPVLIDVLDFCRKYHPTIKRWPGGWRNNNGRNHL